MINDEADEVIKEHFDLLNPNLNGGEVNLTPSWCSVTDSETVKFITLTFCSIQ